MFTRPPIELTPEGDYRLRFSDSERELLGRLPAELLELLATDPGSKSDVPSWAKLSGNTLVDTSGAEGAFRYVIRKA